MPINIEELDYIYSTSIDSNESNDWIAISDLKRAVLIVNA